MAKITKFIFLGNPSNGFVSDFDIDVPGLLVNTNSLTIISPVTNPNTQSLLGLTTSDTSNNLDTFLDNFILNVEPTLSAYTTVSAYTVGDTFVNQLSIDYVQTVRYKLEFYGNPVSSTGFALDIKRNGTVLRNIDKTFNASLSSLSFVPTGATGNITAQNLLTNLQTYNSSTAITYSLSSGFNSFGYYDIYIDVVGIPTDVFTLAAFSNNTSAINTYAPSAITSTDVVDNIYYFTEDILNLTEDVRARSPKLLISTGTTAQTFSTSVFTISQFEGDVNDYATQPVSYVKTKAKITPTQDNIWINISNLIREDLEVDISYYSNTDYTTARNLSLNESKWVYINTVNEYLSSGVTTGDTFYFVVDGYIEPSETQGLPNLLLTGDKRYIYRGSNERLYFKTDGLTGATYSSASAGPTTITFSGDENFNYGYVKSIKVDTPISDPNMTYTFYYEGGSGETVTYNFYDECKYDVYDLVFKNKYGMMETLSMSKKSSKVLNIESSDYLRSIVNLEGVYDVNRHTMKQFNVAGIEEWTLNTDYIPEYMNGPIKEAMLTEEMWLIDGVGNIIPVVKMDQNLAFKTSLNDKLIQYTIKVNLSHNTVQNIL